MNDLNMGADTKEPLEKIRAAQSDIAIAKNQFQEINDRENTCTNTISRYTKRKEFNTNELEFYALDSTFFFHILSVYFFAIISILDGQGTTFIVFFCLFPSFPQSCS